MKSILLARFGGAVGHGAAQEAGPLRALRRRAAGGQRAAPPAGFSVANFAGLFCGPVLQTRFAGPLCGPALQPGFATPHRPLPEPAAQTLTMPVFPSIASIVTDTSPSPSSAPADPAAAAQVALAAPSAPLKNRLLCMVYEAMLLFGVLFIATWLFSTLLQQRHALYLRDALQDWLFVVLGVYFCWFWTHGGQTLAMKTWRIRVIGRDGQRLGWRRALIRYVLAWGWFLPGLAVARFTGAQGWMLLLLPALNFAVWAAAAVLDRDRQFLHDRIAGTRVVLKPGLDKKDAKAAAEDASEHRAPHTTGADTGRGPGS